MNALVYWLISALVCVVIAGWIGRRVKYLGPGGVEKDGWVLGILIDERQRFSLTHLQTVLWTLVFLSLVMAIFLARFLDGTPNDALSIRVPQEILTLIGISAGSAVVATAIKSPRSDEIRARAKAKILDASVTVKPHSHFSQVFMVEEGELTDKVVDVTKFQNFFLTLIAVGAYIALAFSVLGAAQEAPSGLPGFSQDLLWFIGISHTAYVGGKIPEKP